MRNEAVLISWLSNYVLEAENPNAIGMNRNFFVTSLWIILVSLLVSYLAVASISGDWRVFQWKTQRVENWKLVGEAVLVVLFIVFRKKLKAD